MTPASMLRVRWLGRLPYAEAWDLQKAIWEGRVSGRTAEDYLLLLEHPPVYTIGRNGDGSNLLVDRGELAERGVEVYDVDRGGDITYHGPGQLVGYPIVGLPDPKMIVPHVRRMEQVLIDTLADLGVESWREEGLTGVWTEKGKIAAIGVRVSRKVSTHGFALNLDPDMTAFDQMYPCGIRDRRVTSVREVLGRVVSLEEAVEVLIPHFQRAFGHESAETQLGAFTRGQGKDRSYEVDRLLEAGTFSPEARGADPILIGGRLPGEPPRPDWMRVTATTGFRIHRSQEDDERSRTQHRV